MYLREGQKRQEMWGARPISGGVMLSFVIVRPTPESYYHKWRLLSARKPNYVHAIFISPSLYPSIACERPSNTIANIMEALLNQSKAMCPFLKKTSAATLRSLSTATRPAPVGSKMSNLQVMARRCPVMSKALAVQSARMRSAGFATAAAGASTKNAGAKAKIHTTAGKRANVEPSVYRRG